MNVSSLEMDLSAPSLPKTDSGVLAVEVARTGEPPRAQPWYRSIGNEFIRVSWGKMVSLAGLLVAIIILGPLFYIQVKSISRAPIFGPASLVEEMAYTLTSSSNYLTYGFWQSGFLQDFSSSLDPADHPFVYNHMPPGPDILLALLRWLTGDDMRIVRWILAGVCLFGMWFYVRFVQLILDRMELKGAGFALLFIGPWFLVQFMERVIYNFFPLLAFYPYVALVSFYKTGKRRHLYLAAATAFLSSLYFEYSLLTGVVISWLMVYVTGLIPMKRKHALTIFGMFVLGVGLHLFQNFLYLGPELFFEELRITIGNRTLGRPSQEELKSFYRSVGMVHHGSHRPRTAVLRGVIRSNFDIDSPFLTMPVKIGMLAFFLTFFLRFIRNQDRKGPPEEVADARPIMSPMRFFVSLGWWIGLTLLAPILLFPAFAQEVNLRGNGANYFFLAIAEVALVLFSLRVLAGWVLLVLSSLRNGRAGMRAMVRWARDPVGRSPLGEAWVMAGLLGLYLCNTLWTAGALLPFIRILEFGGVVGRFEGDHFAALENLKKFPHELFVTNINTPTVGVFTQAPGYGVCGPDAIGSDGDIHLDKCKVAFMRQTKYDHQKPRYFFFFWSPELFPGFGEVLPTQTLIGTERGGNDKVKEVKNRLETHYLRVHQNSLFAVYDLRRKPNPVPAWECTARVEKKE